LSIYIKETELKHSTKKAAGATALDFRGCLWSSPFAYRAAPERISVNTAT